MPVRYIASNTDEDQREAVGIFLNRYAITLHIDDMCNEGVRLKDHKGHFVAPAYAEIREGYLHTSKPYAEIMVLVAGGMIVGWSHKDYFIDAEDRYLLPVDALSPMPETFSFTAQCAHLSVHGGVALPGEDHWQCLGCNQTVVIQ